MKKMYETPETEVFTVQLEDICGYLNPLDPPEDLTMRDDAVQGDW